MIYYKVQFYADLKNYYQNKFFSFNVESQDKYFNCLFKFWKNGNTFRAIYLKSVEPIGDYNLTNSIELIGIYNFLKEFTGSKEIGFFDFMHEYYKYLSE